MSLMSIILTAIGLAMDAFAVSITIGLHTSKQNRRKVSIKAGLFFGVFQALMPVIGWLLGIKFIQYIKKIDHWIAFILLATIGVKMIIDSVKENDDEVIDVHTNKRFIILAIATSIDALAAGLSFAFLEINILYAASIIGIVTFVLSYGAVYIGKGLGGFLQKKAGIFGGVVLIAIGTNILLEHMNVL